MLSTLIRSTLLIGCALLSLESQAQSIDPRASLKLAESLEFRPIENPARGEHEPPVRLEVAEDVASSVAMRLVLSKADALVGTPYRLGGDSDDDIDCSALVQKAFRVAGLELPRTTRELAKIGEKVDRTSLRPGDLLFYRWNRNRLHVAMYAGNNEIVHASPNAQQVTRTRLNNDWNRRLVSVRRLI
jgi:murein DD-endopeptidase / murein LD-carboxypeptidase